MFPCMITVHPRATRVLPESTSLVTRMLLLAQHYTYHAMYNVVYKVSCWLYVNASDWFVLTSTLSTYVTNCVPNNVTHILVQGLSIKSSTSYKSIRYVMAPFLFFVVYPYVGAYTRKGVSTYTFVCNISPQDVQAYTWCVQCICMNIKKEHTLVRLRSMSTTEHM